MTDEDNFDDVREWAHPTLSTPPMTMDRIRALLAAYDERGRRLTRAEEWQDRNAATADAAEEDLSE